MEIGNVSNLSTPKYGIVLSLDFITIWGLGLVVLVKYDTVFFISFNKFAEGGN